MSLLRLIGNAIRIIAYVLYGCLYWPGRLLGNKLAFVPWMILSAYLINRYHSNFNIYVGLFGWAFCRMILKTVKPPPKLVLLRGSAPPPPPPPIASTAKGRADDPDEATVIGRLDPKLRDLLRQKPDAAASGPTAS